MKTGKQTPDEIIAEMRAAGVNIVEHGTGANSVPAPAEDVSEKQFMAEVVRFARRNNWLIYHTTNSRKSAAGFPDLILIRGNRLIVAELKVARNEPTPAQERWLCAFHGAGVKAYLWRPEHWGEIIETLKG